MSMRKDNLLGFVWDADVISTPESKLCFDAIKFYRQGLFSFVRDAALLEDNPVEHTDIMLLIEGRSVGGYLLSDVEQVINLIDSGRKLMHLVNIGSFDLNKETIILLHSIIARNEALEWGVFRGEGEEKYYTPSVELGERDYYLPSLTRDRAVILNAVFNEGMMDIKMLLPYEGALVMFLFCALQQFFFDGNKRTGRHMMNGWLMKHGFSPISIPAGCAQEFNDKMVRFYVSKDATEMLAFLDRCRKNDFV